MDYFKDFKTIILWTIFLICVGVYVLGRKRRYKLHPGPRGLPFFGILPFLGKNPHEYLDKLGKKYGGIFGTYLGGTYIVIVTDAAVARKLFSLPSTVERPPGLFQLLPGGSGFAELNGAAWTEQRRYSMMEMKNLGLGRSDWEDLMQMEVSDIMDMVAKSKGEPIDISNVLAASLSNNILSLVTNQRLPMEDPNRLLLNRGVKSFEAVYNQSGLIIYYPKLFKLLASLGFIKVEQNLKDMRALNKYLREKIEYLRKNEEEESFINKYLKEIEKSNQLNLQNSFTYENLVGNVQSLFIAGSDTTHVSILWLLLVMASHKSVQEKVHEELDTVLGKDGRIDWMGRQKLPYCLAVIMEAQRWRTVAPLNVLHRASEDIEFDGYEIPKHSFLLTIQWSFHNDTKYWKDPDMFQPERFLADEGKVINEPEAYLPFSYASEDIEFDGYEIPKHSFLLTIQWSFHNDTKYWKDPDMFQPERFLADEGKVINEPEAYLPFSYGKRICPGKYVALIEVFQYFVAFMQRFEILPALDRPNLEGVAGLTFEPKPQPLRFIPR